jgi:hypothetical protein
MDPFVQRSTTIAGFEMGGLDMLVVLAREADLE